MTTANTQRRNHDAVDRIANRSLKRMTEDAGNEQPRQVRDELQQRRGRDALAKNPVHANSIRRITTITPTIQNGTRFLNSVA